MVDLQEKPERRFGEGRQTSRMEEQPTTSSQHLFLTDWNAQIWAKSEGPLRKPVRLLETFDANERSCRAPVCGETPWVARGGKRRGSLDICDRGWMRTLSTPSETELFDGFVSSFCPDPMVSAIHLTVEQPIDLSSNFGKMTRCGMHEMRAPLFGWTFPGDDAVRERALENGRAAAASHPTSTFP